MRRAGGGWVGGHERAAALRRRTLSYRLADGAASSARGGRRGRQALAADCDSQRNSRAVVVSSKPRNNFVGRIRQCRSSGQ